MNLSASILLDRGLQPQNCLLTLKLKNNLHPWWLSDMKFTIGAALIPYLDVAALGFGRVLSVIESDLLKVETGVNVTTKTGHNLILFGKNCDCCCRYLGISCCFWVCEKFP